MPRVVIISILILSVVIWFAIQAKQSGHQTIAVALFTGAGAYALILLGGFFGFLGSWG